MRDVVASMRMAARAGRASIAGRVLGILGGMALFMIEPGVALANGSKSPSSANGYSVRLANPAVSRYYPGNGEKPYPFRPANEHPSGVDFQDCEDNIQLAFDLLETASQGQEDILQVWAGTTDCTQVTARAGAEPPFCWQVAAPQTFTTAASVEVYVRSLARFVDTQVSSVPNGGDPVLGPGQPESACRTQDALGAQPLSLYFMMVPGGGDSVPDAYLEYAVDVDLLGPPAPTDVVVTQESAASLTIDWSPPAFVNVKGFELFVADQGEVEAGHDACGSGVFVDTWTRQVTLPAGGGTVIAGDSDVDPSKYSVGTLGGSDAASFSVTALPDGGPLLSGHRYAVAVASYDNDGNTGPLSTLACDVAAADPGGSAGAGNEGARGAAGGCSVARVGSNATDSAMGFAFGTALLWIARRRRDRGEVVRT